MATPAYSIGMRNGVLPQRLRSERVRVGETLEDASAGIGLSVSTISRHETGKRHPDPDQLSDYSRYYKVDSDYLLGLTDRRNRNETPIPKSATPLGPMVKVPVLGSIRAGAPMFTDENIVDWELTPTEDVQNGEFFYLTVEGDSMAPDITGGSRVLVHYEAPVEQDGIAVVLIEKDQAVIKHVRYLDNQIMLYSSNPAYAATYHEPDEIKIIGRVDEMRKKFPKKLS